MGDGDRRGRGRTGRMRDVGRPALVQRDGDDAEQAREEAEEVGRAGGRGRGAGAGTDIDAAGARARSVGRVDHPAASDAVDGHQDAQPCVHLVGGQIALVPDRSATPAVVRRGRWLDPRVDVADAGRQRRRTAGPGERMRRRMVAVERSLPERWDRTRPRRPARGPDGRPDPALNNGRLRGGPRSRADGRRQLHRARDVDRPSRLARRGRRWTVHADQLCDLGHVRSNGQHLVVGAGGGRGGVGRQPVAGHRRAHHRDTVGRLDPCGRWLRRGRVGRDRRAARVDLRRSRRSVAGQRQAIQVARACAAAGERDRGRRIDRGHCRRCIRSGVVADGPRRAQACLRLGGPSCALSSLC